MSTVLRMQSRRLEMREGGREGERGGDEVGEVRDVG